MKCRNSKTNRVIPKLPGAPGFGITRSEMLDLCRDHCAYPTMWSETNLGVGPFLSREGEKQIGLCLPSVPKINQLLYKSFMETEGGITCVEISTDVKPKQK